MGLTSVCCSVETVFGFHVLGLEDRAGALEDIGTVLTLTDAHPMNLH